MKRHLTGALLLLSILRPAGDRLPTSQGQEVYLGLKKLGVPPEFVTYPREPHGFREPNHRVDRIERELAWFTKWGVK